MGAQIVLGLFTVTVYGYSCTVDGHQL